MAMIPSEASAAPRCRRCGQCCLRGGPTLMSGDAPLLESGALPLSALVCLRAGEWARDDARGTLRPLQGEMLKLAGAAQGENPADAAHPWRCLYYLDGVGGAGCGIYERRPAQCRILFCADTAPLEALLASGQRLDRRAALEALTAAHLPPGAALLWSELMAAHEEQCPARPCLELAARLGFTPLAAGRAAAKTPNAGERQAALARLAEAARCDAAFRDLCVERAGVPAAVLLFLLGRPLAVLLAEVGVRGA